MKRFDATGFAWALGCALAATLAGVAMSGRFDVVNIAMVYLLGVVVVALRHSRGAAILAAAVSVLALDILFVPPAGTLRVDDLQYLLTFAIMLAVALVITHLKQVLAAKARAQAALEVEAEAERIRSALLASISHDLRTPLAVMTGASSTLVERGERMAPADRIALAQGVYRQASEISAHVAKILDMTRLETGRVEPDRDWVSLAEIAGSVLARLAGRLGQHRLMVEVPDDLPLVLADATLIDQALGNLLENAAKHTPAGTVVMLRMARAGRDIVVSVEDFGGGLPERDLERVFAKFQHGPGARSDGVGLGLAIARAIVRLHGGRAWAERLPEGGTAFRFTVPLPESPPAMPAEAAA